MACEFDPANYPRMYELSIVLKISFVLLGLFLIGLSLTGVYLEVAIKASHSLEDIVPDFIIALLGLYPIIWQYQFKVVLLPDAIEVPGVFSTQILLRSEIAGTRLLRYRYARKYSLGFIPKDPDIKMIEVVNGLINRDAYFDSWMKDIPDLDQMDTQKTQD